MIANKDYALIKAIKNRCKCNGDSSSEGGGSIDLDSMSTEELDNLMYQASVKGYIRSLERDIEQYGHDELVDSMLSVLKNAPENVSDITTKGNIKIARVQDDPPISTILSPVYSGGVPAFIVLNNDGNIQ